MDIDFSRVKRLAEYTKKLIKHENGKQLYLQYQADIDMVKPGEVLEILYEQVEAGTPAEEILIHLDKIVCVFYHSLVAYQWEKPHKQSFLGLLMQENKALLEKLEQLTIILKNKDKPNRQNILISRVKELLDFNDHYVKKENILFPYLEKKADKFHGLAIMWALHNKARSLIKKLLELLATNDSEKEVNIAIGELFFALKGLVQKEELILFPIAFAVLTELEWDEMQVQSAEYEFPFIPKPEIKALDKKLELSKEKLELSDGYLFKTNTGSLNLSQILLIFDALPVDLTLIDEHNQVNFFSRPKERIFPRSAAVIGRDVKNCHPPESVEKVMEIIEAFRNGQKETAVFWLQVRGKELLIKYFALRDAEGSYQGTLEVSQDITDIKKLAGERRLLDWD